MKRFLQDKKNLIILLLSVLFLIRAHGENIRYAFWVLGGVIVAAIGDILINRIFLHRRIFPKSAVISGFITAGLLDHYQPWFVLVIFPLVAIFSKYIFRFKAKHIFNPANFALFCASLFRIPLTWSLESNIYIIIFMGIYIAYSIKKMPQILGFLVFFTGLFSIQGINPFGLLGWFFIFIMLIEPKTSVSKPLAGFIFGSIAGITSFVIFKLFPQYDFFIGSLFIANMFNPLLEKIRR